MGVTDALQTGSNKIGGRAASHSREGSTSSSTCSSAGSDAMSDAPPPYSKCDLIMADNNINPPDGLSEGSDGVRLLLDETRRELERSRAECGRLAQIRDDVEAEVRELTASLFQEAHVMVNAANVKAAAAEKALRESRMQVEVLTAEVEALKTLVLTSTPSQPNAHLHPQLSASLSSNSIHQTGCPRPSSSGNGNGALKMFTRHRRGASDCDLKYPPPVSHQSQAEPTLSSSPETGHKSNITQRGNGDGASTSSSSNQLAAAASASTSTITADQQREEAVDPVLYYELEHWRSEPSLAKGSSGLMKRIFDEDADRCLSFPCVELGERVRRAVEDNDIFIEELSSSPQPTCCALLKVNRTCRYRIKLGNDDDWHYISSLCRNRITAVCDTLTYLRYIRLGLVKSPLDDVYWELMRLRKNMTLARLGLTN